jgi:hypothetical protein
VKYKSNPPLPPGLSDENIRNLFVKSGLKPITGLYSSEEVFIRGPRLTGELQNPFFRMD